MNKIILQILAIVASAYFIISYFSVEKNSSNEKLENKQPHITLSDALKKEVVTTNKNGKKTDPNITPDIISEPTIDQLIAEASLVQQQEIVDWFIARGYLGLDKPSDSDPRYLILSDYNTYSAETLIELAKSGDAYANLIISTKLVIADKYEAAIPYLYEDSINGYSSSMYKLGHAYLLKFQMPETFPADKSALLESLAWAEAAQLRGDPYGESADRYIDHEREEYRITENEYNEILTRAQNIYNEIQEKRLNRGKGLFDNSTPELLIMANSF